jgi:hypothetical protein
MKGRLGVVERGSQRLGYTLLLWNVLSHLLGYGYPRHGRYGELALTVLIIVYWIKFKFCVVDRFQQALQGVEGVSRGDGAQCGDVDEVCMGFRTFRE